MISFAKTAPKTARKSKPYNAPEFRARADKPDVGYWYVWHDGKQQQLTPYGATRSNVKPGSRAYVAEVIPAFNAWQIEYDVNP